MTHLEDRIQALKEKTSDNDDQQARIKTLSDLATTRLAQLKEGISLRERGEEAARESVGRKAGKETMDAIRAVVTDMEATEHQLLKDRESALRNAFWIAVTTGFLTAAIGLGLVAMFLRLLQRSLAARQRAATAVHEQREWLRTTLSSIGDGVIATDPHGKVAFLNGVAAKLTGWVPEEADGQPLELVFNIVNEETRQPVENPALRALKEGKIVGLANHTILISKAGTDWPVDDSAAPIRDEQGKVNGVVLVFREITERKKAEHEVGAPPGRRTDPVGPAAPGRRGVPDPQFVRTPRTAFCGSCGRKRGRSWERTMPTS